MERFEVSNGRREVPREGIGPKGERLELSKGGDRRWDGAIEGVLAEVEDDELGELGYEWSECARVALRVKGDRDDSG